MRKWKHAAKLTILCSLLIGAAAPGTAEAAADRTSKYRVYQNDKALMEFSDQSKAVQYAKSFNHAYVEQIGTRSLVWDNFPKYKVYQKDASKPEWEFQTLKAAAAEAKKWANASVRELSSGGWVWDNYPEHPGFTLYQGDKTLPGWQFPTLEKAKAEGKRWGNAHIIDKSNNRWVWDNISQEKKQELRQGPKRYQVYQGQKTMETWAFAYLQDAVNESLKWADSHIVNKDKNNETVFRNEHRYIVYRNDAKASSFVGLESAIKAASKLDNASIVWDGRTIWSNSPYFRVMQEGVVLSGFNLFKNAVSFAAKMENSEIVTLDGLRVWDNLRTLMYLAWNGSAKHDTIVGHVSQTQGLDIDSPTWFSLADASGTLKDESDPLTAEWLRSQGVEIHPLVHNQFDAKLTSAFLADIAAQQRFIGALTKRLGELGVHGVNIDFEGMSGSDRDRYTAFVAALSKAAREKGLTVSIDLPRGSILWNHKTAYDHTKLAELVDYIAIMAYDQYYRGSSSPGPVAGLTWTEEGVQEYLSYGIPRSKLLLGVPFYVRVWELDAGGKLVSNRAIWMKDVPELLESAEVSTTKDEKHGLDRVDFNKDGKRYVFWMEDIGTIGQRIELAKKYDLAGIAAWRLGYEPLDLWTAMLRAK
ncbi:glycosyl hydrolase family 18 protein [Paenibacillus alkalitolerans]|uniref:glycosyl hydrolase family 18 protein n=1 Tax=Paenibacillus alkalitolerans TaxID=2799335 RepID=UPI0018F4DDFC|nr:glycosyl hydrolase family 18 protein [Paenibacillus alkalitolerans]